MTIALEFNTQAGKVQIRLNKDQWKELRHKVDSLFLDSPLFVEPKKDLH